MKSKGVSVVAMSVLFVMFSLGVASAEDFSADMVNISKAGTFNGKIYVAGDKVRMETPQSITITRMDKRVVWILMPQEKMYMEQPFGFDSAVVVSNRIPGELERKRIGQEMVGGKLAQKFQITYTQDNVRQTLYQWFLPGLNIPVKTAAQDARWSMEYKNIKVGRQPDSLFEFPAGYKKFSSQMPSMKGILENLVE